MASLLLQQTTESASPSSDVMLTISSPLHALDQRLDQRLDHSLSALTDLNEPAALRKTGLASPEPSSHGDDNVDDDTLESQDSSCDAQHTLQNGTDPQSAPANAALSPRPAHTRRAVSDVGLRPKAASLAARRSSSLSLLFPDTAPRGLWRPQLEFWMKKNHPSVLREIAISKPAAGSSGPANSASAAAALAASKKRSRSEWDDDSCDELDHQRISPTKRAAPVKRPQAYTKDNNNYTTAKLAKPNPTISPPPQHSSISSPQPLSHPNSSSDDVAMRRQCISCGSEQSPCWRPSWSAAAGQLCNSCGLRYKKTGARCLVPSCGRIPAKGEWVAMKSYAGRDEHGHPTYACLYCGGGVEYRG